MTINLTALIVLGVSLAGSFLGAYVAIRVSLARFEVRLEAIKERIDRHSNRLTRIEDHWLSGDLRLK